MQRSLPAGRPAKSRSITVAASHIPPEPTFSLISCALHTARVIAVHVASDRMMRLAQSLRWQRITLNSPFLPPTEETPGFARGNRSIIVCGQLCPHHSQKGRPYAVGSGRFQCEITHGAKQKWHRKRLSYSTRPTLPTAGQRPVRRILVAGGPGARRRSLTCDFKKLFWQSRSPPTARI